MFEDMQPFDFRFFIKETLNTLSEQEKIMRSKITMYIFNDNL